MAWPTPPNMIMNGSCIKIQVHSVVDEYSGLRVPDETRTEVFVSMGDMLHSYVQWPRQHVKLLNGDAPSKSNTSRMASSQESPCHKSSSSQTQDNDTTIDYRPQIEVDPFLQIQPPGYMMQAQGSYMSLLMNVNNLQTASQNSFELHDFNLEINPNPLPEPEPAPEFELEPKPEPAFSDPDVCLALERIKLKPPRIQELADQLQIGIGKNHYIRVDSPDGMYPQPIYENILYSDLLNMLLEGWLDVTILHWFAMHFFESPNSRCAFFNPNKVTGSRCRTLFEDVKKHVKEIRELHSKKVFYLAPYLARKHWSLIIVCPDFKFGYIVDSIKEGKTHKKYKLVKIIEDAFGINFNWHMA
ncbi:putative papain-like cysteine peptidase superfamily [Helianthus debilis subsp. tardiflorus]